MDEEDDSPKIRTIFIELPKYLLFHIARNDVDFKFEEEIHLDKYMKSATSNSNQCYSLYAVLVQTERPSYFPIVKMDLENKWIMLDVNDAFECEKEQLVLYVTKYAAALVYKRKS